MNDVKDLFNFYDQTYLKSYNLDDSLQYQLKVLDSLDVYTRKHCESVATITCNLCHKLHLSRGFTEYTTICAYLHDIGKQFIPPSVLQKPAKLTDEEYEIMKTHTTLGYNLCMKDPKLRPYHAGTYYHHECLNGTGYPQGLLKKDIPFEAQIIKVADEYDAIVNKRQYKSHIGISEALKIIIDKTKAGQNNKTVVKALLKVVINDIEYELSCIMDYVTSLKKEIKRYEKIDYYNKKRLSAKNEENKIYYEEYMKLYLNSNETIDRFEQLYAEIVEAYNLRKNEVTNLYNEIKTIKKIRI